MHIRIPTLFRIWYSTTYTVLFFILIILLAVTLGDTIYQSVRTNELQKIFVVAGAYLLTFLITLLVYSTRLYTNRSVLQSIPKPYIPIEDGEVGKMVRRMIVKALRRSAIVAWDSRPRDLMQETHNVEDASSRPTTAERSHKRRSHGPETTIIPVSPQSPPWGHVSHPGWASPSSPDLPDLQYWDVITELPNLIEAKAVSLAPPDSAVEEQSHDRDNTPLLPDAQIVALLQRPRSMGLRDYLGQLASYGLINPPDLAPKFLHQYEYARFSTRPLTETEFRDLMAVFAVMLNGMNELDPTIFEEARLQTMESDTRSLTASEMSGSSGTSAMQYRTPRDFGRTEYFRDGLSYRDDSESPQTLRTALSHPRQFRSSSLNVPRTPSVGSLRSETGSVRIRPVQRSPSTILPNSSSSSLRSAESVVRLQSSPPGWPS